MIKEVQHTPPDIIPGMFYSGLPGLLPGLLIGAGTVLFSYVFIHKTTLERASTQVSKSVQILIKIRDMLMKLPNTKDEFPDPVLVIPSGDIKLYKITDHLLIQDFQDALVSRSQIISNSSTIDPGSIWYINAKCLDLCERLLREVDWEKYREGGKR
jgi:hypothetical protein